MDSEADEKEVQAVCLLGAQFKMFVETYGKKSGFAFCMASLLMLERDEAEIK